MNNYNNKIIKIKKKKKKSVNTYKADTQIILKKKKMQYLQLPNNKQRNCREQKKGCLGKYKSHLSRNACTAVSSTMEVEICTLRLSASRAI